MDFFYFRLIFNLPIFLGNRNSETLNFMQVVELLIQKLENEPSLHRRVDLFFLVDSITQCSHSQRGMEV